MKGLNGLNNEKIGYVFLWRKLINSRIWNNPELLKIWIWCLLKTNHSDNWVTFSTGKGESEVFVKRGQFIFGRNSASEELKMKPSTIYKRMIKLKNIGNLELKSNTHYSIVTICNWEKYQNIKSAKEQAKEQASSRQVAGKEQASSTNNNEKNDNNEKNEDKRNISGEAKVVIEYLNTTCNRNYQKLDEVKARLNDGATVEECIRVIDVKKQDPYFIQNPHFMRPKTLFKKSNFDDYLNQKPEDFVIKKKRDKGFDEREEDYSDNPDYIFNNTETDEEGEVEDGD